MVSDTMIDWSVMVSDTMIEWSVMVSDHDGLECYGV